MSEEASKQKLQEMLNTLYGNIVQFAREDMLPTAEKAFYSTRDYALGDVVSSSASAAIENCEQIRTCFPAGTPKEAFASIDKVEAEINRIEAAKRPRFFAKWWILIILAAIVYFVYFILTHNRGLGAWTHPY